MLKRSLILFLLVVPAVLFADVTSDFDRDIDLSAVKTFRFADQSMRHPKDALFGDELAAKRMRNGIRESFAAIGLQETSSNPDVIVAFYASLDQKRKIVTTGYGRPGWLGVGRQTAWAEEYTDGTAVIDLLDPETGEVIWRGRVSGTITLNNADKRTRDGMRRLAGAFKKDRDKQARQ
jgi:hypothetical protein